MCNVEKTTLLENNNEIFEILCGFPTFKILHYDDTE